MQRELIFNLLAEGLVFADADNIERLAGVRSVNTNQMFSYLLSEKAYFDENYAALYADFLTLLSGE